MRMRRSGKGPFTCQLQRPNTPYLRSQSKALPVEASYVCPNNVLRHCLFVALVVVIENMLASVVRLSETIDEAEGKVEEAYSIRKEEGERRSE